MYVLTNGVNFLKIDKNSNISETSELKEAYRFKKKCDKFAENLCRSSKVTGKWRCVSYYEEVEEENADIAMLKNQIRKTLIKESIDDISTHALYGLVESISEGINLKLEELRKNLSIKDQEINDITHAMEFYKLNACEGYKIYNLMHQKLLERREIKNEIEKIDRLFDYSVKKIHTTNYEQGVGKEKKKKYTPRVLNELFEK